MERRDLMTALLTGLALVAVTCLSGTAVAGQEQIPVVVPKGLIVQARHVKLRKPVSIMRAGKLVEIFEILEFEVTAKESIPARALDPVLVVGERLVTSYRYAAPNRLIFIEHQPGVLKEGSAVYFQWGRRVDTRHRLKLSFEFRRAALIQETR
jgi:hypothetical protein